MSDSKKYPLFLFMICALVATQSCETLTGAHRKSSAGGGGQGAASGTVSNTIHGANAKKVADLIMGDGELKDSIQEFTPMAHRATSDYMGGSKAITNPVNSGKSVSFNGKAVFDVGQISMCSSGTRIKPQVAAVFNNSDVEGRVTWYGLLEACLGFEESGIHWDEGSRSWKMRDSKASGANARKTVGGFAQLDSYAKQNAGMMDACIHQWNEEGHGYNISDSKGQPKGGYSLDSITSNEKGNLRGQEFSIRCMTQMISMQGLLQKNSGQCINPFASKLNHFGPLQSEERSGRIQSCMGQLFLGKSSLSGQSLADVRRNLQRLPGNYIGPESCYIVDGKPIQRPIGHTREANI